MLRLRRSLSRRGRRGARSTTPARLPPLGAPAGKARATVLNVAQGFRACEEIDGLCVTPCDPITVVLRCAHERQTAA